MQQARERAARRASNAARNIGNAGLPKIVAGAMKRNAQETAGKSNETHGARVSEAQARLDTAGRALRDEQKIALELEVEPDCGVIKRAEGRVAMPEAQRMNLLARFLFRGPRIHLPVGVLSGGERLRATLACVLFAEPAPQLLLLDEPTNNLDLVSVGQLENVLNAYQGAFVVVSHDERFLAEIKVERWLGLRDGRLRESGPL
jgi:ATPase subunit of ABC transporter with duplicated ATPase domains